MAAPRASFRRDSQETDQRPLARTPQSPGVDSGNWRLGAANRLFRLPAGFYGLTTILLFVACMTLARVRTPESLRYQAPGEWGAILGLDRGPETKTLRRKLKLLTSAEHTVRDWQSALART